MVRKAETVKSIGELNLSTDALTSLISGRFTPEKAIYHGRYMAYLDDEHPKRKERRNYELIGALEEANLLRHDIKPSSFIVNRLYRAVYRDTLNVINAPSYFPNLRKAFLKYSGSTILTRDDFKIGNKRYEDFDVPTAEQLETIDKILKTHLTEEEYRIFTCRLGFEDGETLSIARVGELYGLTTGQVTQIEKRAAKKLKKAKALPPLKSTAETKRVDSIIETIKELQENDPDGRIVLLKQELYAISKAPFDCAATAKDFLDNDTVNPRGIEHLDLSARSYNCLKREKIYTIDDILYYPKRRWKNIANLGKKSMMEIEEKTRAAGYPDFYIFTPEKDKENPSNWSSNV